MPPDKSSPVSGALLSDFRKVLDGAGKRDPPIAHMPVPSPDDGPPKGWRVVRGLSVKSRKIVNLLSKKMRMGQLPVFESLDRGEMA